MNELKRREAKSSGKANRGRGRQSGLLAVSAVMASGGLAHTALAVTPTWNNSGTDFNAAGDWSSPSSVPSTGDTAIFSGAASMNPNLSASDSIAELNFSTTSTSGYTLSASSGHSLTLTGSTAISFANTTGSNTITAPLVITANSAGLSGAGGGTLVISGNISDTGTGALFLNTGSAVYTLSGTNSLSGGINLVNSGVSLNIGSSGALGSGPLQFGGGSGYLLNNTSGGALTFTNAVQIQRTSGPVTNFGFTGTNNLTFSTGSLTLSFNGLDGISVTANTLTFGGIVVGNGSSSGISKLGAGTLALGGASAFAGGVTVSTGVLDINNGGNATTSAIGTGALTLGNGTAIDNTSGSSLTLGTNNAQSWTGNLTFIGSNSMNLGTGSVTLGGASTMTTTANTLTVGGAISGNFSLTKSGAGALVLNGADAYTGNTTVTAGTLVAGYTGALTGNVSSTGAGNVTLNGGTLSSTAGADAYIFGLVASGSGANTIAPGGAGAVGSLTVGGLSLTGNSTLNFDITNSTIHDLLADSGSLTATGVTNVVVPTGLAESSAQVIELASYVGSTSATVSNFEINGGSTPTGYSLTLAGGQLDLTVDAAVPEPTALALLALGGAGAMLRRRRTSPADRGKDES
jgi:autotransporter-associated beta strand protein